MRTRGDVKFWWGSLCAIKSAGLSELQHWAGLLRQSLTLAESMEIFFRHWRHQLLDSSRLFFTLYQSCYKRPLSQMLQ